MTLSIEETVKSASVVKVFPNNISIFAIKLLKVKIYLSLKET